MPLTLVLAAAAGLAAGLAATQGLAVMRLQFSPVMVRLVRAELVVVVRQTMAAAGNNNRTVAASAAALEFMGRGHQAQGVRLA
jgi:hypothetical protein